MASTEFPFLEMLSKNLSYEGNYHRKIFYAKVVYNRIRERKLGLAAWQGFNAAANGSFERSQQFHRSLSSSDSLPDLSINVLQDDKGAMMDASQSRKLRRFSSTENCSFDGLKYDSEGIDIKPFLGDSESPVNAGSSTSLQLSSSVESVDKGGLHSREGSMDEINWLAMVRGGARRRSSSLKCRSPKSSEHSERKKSVRFADAMGLDLQLVKHIFNKDDPPILPRAALQDLKKGLEEAHRTEGTRYICALFTQPGLDSCFLERVKSRKIALEKCLIDDHDRTVTGMIRAANICYNKVVLVRYTLNDWITFDDIAASYVLNSNDGITDRFVFTITLPTSMMVGNRLQFAIKFVALDHGESYWDNNFGDNYQIMCYARAIPTHKSDSTWMHFL